MWEKLEQINKRFEELVAQMSNQEIATDHVQMTKLAQEKSSLDGIIGLYQDYKATVKSLEETKSMLNEKLDAEMAAMAKEEAHQLEEKRDRLQEELKLALLPKDPNDEKNIIMEIRAGAGGDEAAIFAAELFRMYSRYAQNRRWNVDVISSSESIGGGIKEIILEISGKGVFSRLKYERGVHRVQRVPVTESSGRIHTSTATIAVLPEAEEVDLEIDPSDLRVDIFHSGGAGGQNVNKVATAVRLTHFPTGMVVICQDERSQLRNRQKAMAVLRSRLLDMETTKQQQEMSSMRRSQVGSGERSEKIRTYNFPQDRLSDHRIGLTLHSLPRIMQGELDEMIDALASDEQSKLLQEQLS
ncbi:MAG TPA: peptide chain release factor 1 [Dehalococcoidales bacterium]|nr:peptide chain release factor 1 [Dehalococcoidales bacterium]